MATDPALAGSEAGATAAVTAGVGHGRGVEAPGIVGSG